jgi:predicted thioesterase
MEQAALHTLEPHLPDTHTSVGTRIVLDHTGAARMGECFSCEVEIDRIEGRKVVFSIRASTDEKELGLAEHTRVIVDRARFMARVLE